MDKIENVFEFAWLTTQQVVVTSDKQGSNIKTFGSGFFFQYRDNLFFVTADHVSHSDDFEEGIRLGKDDYLWVLNNKNNTTELSTMLTPIGGLFSFDQMNCNDELSFEIPDMKDITFAMLPNSFKVPFVTHELKVDNKVIVMAGEEKLILDFHHHCTTELEESDYCLIEGCVKWDIKNEIYFSRSNAIHRDLILKDVDVDGYYNLKYSCPVKYDEWAGLSGGPVFNQNAKLIGMAIEVNSSNDTVTVIPINKITKLMDIAINYELSIGKVKSSNQ